MNERTEFAYKMARGFKEPTTAYNKTSTRDENRIKRKLIIGIH